MNLLLHLSNFRSLEALIELRVTLAQRLKVAWWITSFQLHGEFSRWSSLFITRRCMIFQVAFLQAFLSLFHHLLPSSFSFSLFIFLLSCNSFCLFLLHTFTSHLRDLFWYSSLSSFFLYSKLYFSKKNKLCIISLRTELVVCLKRMSILCIWPLLCTVWISLEKDTLCRSWKTNSL